MHPRPPVGSLQKFGGFRIAGNFLFYRVVNQWPSTQLHRKIGKNTTSGRNMSLLNIGYGFYALIYSFKKIEYVPPGGRRSIKFNFWFVQVCRIFFFFIHYIPVYFLSFTCGYKIIFHGTATKGSFIAIKFKRPWIFRISSRAPAAVLPYAV